MSYEWIILKYDAKPNEMRCLRCNSCALAPMPCKLDDAQAIFNTFINIHKKCRKDEKGVKIK